MHYPQNIIGTQSAPVPPTINIGGQLLTFDHPLVMGVLNATPDSFYEESRATTEESIAMRVRQIIREGGDIIDVGACSTRPGAEEVKESEEWARLHRALTIVNREAPDAIISVDTYRAGIAERCVAEHGVHIINDISGGTMDKDMFSTIARLSVPYILTHIQGTPRNMQAAPHYDNVTVEVTRWLAERIDHLHQMGVADIIIDPGFGFGKKLEHNYELLSNLHHLKHELPYSPLLVGVSRKSMIYEPLRTTPENSLHGTTVINTISLERGADILRVHDVLPAVEAIKLTAMLK